MEKMINYKKENSVEERNRLIEENYRLVPYFAKKCVNYGVDFDELCSMGTMGLIGAAKVFDSSRGTKFSTYASKCIMHSITKNISKECRTFRVPSNKSSENTKGYFIVSLDINTGEDGDSSLIDIVADERTEDPFETVAKQYQKESVKAILEFLDPKEAKVLSLHYGIDSNTPMTLEQIAKLPEFDVTRERIRQIENKAISKIRRSPRMRRLLRDIL